MHACAWDQVHVAVSDAICSSAASPSMRCPSSLAANCCALQPTPGPCSLSDAPVSYRIALVVALGTLPCPHPRYSHLTFPSLPPCPAAPLSNPVHSCARSALQKKEDRVGYREQMDSAGRRASAMSLPSAADPPWCCDGPFGNENLVYVWWVAPRPSYAATSHRAPKDAARFIMHRSVHPLFSARPSPLSIPPSISSPSATPPPTPSVI